jgi:thymidylate synthase
MIGRTIEVGGISEGWLAACETLLANPRGEANHLFVRMREPLPEVKGIREIADGVAERTSNGQSVTAVRNTIFPAALAEEFTRPEDLAAEYLADYEVIRRLGSPQGTYFGRICEYPHPDGSVTPQLVQTVEKLIEAQNGKRWRARYQLNIYAGHKDCEKRRGFFPCMGHLAFQLGRGPEGEVDQLDCVALYRYQDMILKGYGNFLGLAELQAYVAQASGFTPGELAVLAGHAHLTLSKGQRALLREAITA